MTDQTIGPHRLLVGNALQRLGDLPAGLAQTCITSPPYWGLRDYGDPGQDWLAVEFTISLGGAECPVSVPEMTAPLGLEPTPIAFVGHLVAIFRELRRVIATDGTVWLNVGDSYAAHNDRASRQGQTGIFGGRHKMNQQKGRAPQPNGMKPKDLVGIPWLLAFALRSDGWYLRSDIIWHKRNPMPESVRDRPTKGHEYVFLLAKCERYLCEMGAIAEAHTSLVPRHKTERGKDSSSFRAMGRPQQARVYGAHGRNRRTVWSITSQPYKSPTGQHFAQMPPALVEPCLLAGSQPGDVVIDPFAGSGTVGAVAEQYGRKFVGIELMESHIPIAVERIRNARVDAGSVAPEEAEPGQQIGLFA
jgi:site-specific DNA-methyltransferase (cytosine-N4-specific)